MSIACAPVEIAIEALSEFMGEADTNNLPVVLLLSRPESLLIFSKSLHDVVHHERVGRKMRISKRGFEAGKSNRLNSSLA
jgi:hypothetical protein